MSKNRNLLIIAIIAIVNALGYGIIIPLLYTYSRSFGLSDFQNGLLFSTFSIGQLISTPIIGRLSDKYGRKPLLLISITGTMGSFLLMGFASSALFLFLARALDGITAGNIPVALAVISDSTEGKDRAKGFGLIGASFGFGFTFGPAITGIFSQFGLSAPFLVAAGVSLVAILATLIFLPETNKHMGEVQDKKLWDLSGLARSLFDKNIGSTLLMSFVYALGFTLFFFGFQPMAVKTFGLLVPQISTIFVALGIIGIVSQGLIIPKIVAKFGERPTLFGSFFIFGAGFLIMFFSRTAVMYGVGAAIFGFGNGFIGPLIQATLSHEVDAKSQGTIMGINSSYAGLGQILGPIAGGVLASFYLPLPFFGGFMISLICIYLAWHIAKRPRPVSEFREEI